jgi:hypothetical protein
MTGQLLETPRDDFILVAEKEPIAFERKERELRRQERRERLQQKFPNLIIELQSWAGAWSGERAGLSARCQKKEPDLDVSEVGSLLDVRR